MIIYVGNIACESRIITPEDDFGKILANYATPTLTLNTTFLSNALWGRDFVAKHSVRFDYHMCHMLYHILK